MKTKINILIAFVLNLFFSIFEFFGGIITGSVAILSDSVHDFGDAISIGASLFLENVSHKKPNEKYTYGYRRFSVLGGLITTVILLTSSIIVIYNAILRIINPIPIDYNGMLIFAIVGLVINLIATYFTHGGTSINQKAVNLHMLEDVLGWLIVLIGAVVMRFTDLYLIDPILSILLALFIIMSSLKNLKQIADIFLIKTPKSVEISHVIADLKNIDGVIDVHHLHVWSLDGEVNCATLHLVTNTISAEIKNHVKHHLNEHGISHVTIEMETELEDCCDKLCEIKSNAHHCCHHH